MTDFYKCCPAGVDVNVSDLATGKLSSVMCLACGRRFIGPRSRLGKGLGIMQRMPGDVFVDDDGSLNALPLETRRFHAAMREWANMRTGDPLSSI